MPTQTPTPTFLSYEEALAAAKREPSVEFIGLTFLPPYNYLAAYVLRVDDECPDFVGVHYSGGSLFSSFGEEDYYDEADVPASVKTVFYARQTDLGNGEPAVMGMNSEYVLWEVLPGLAEPDSYTSPAEFSRVAGQRFTEFWRQA